MTRHCQRLALTAWQAIACLLVAGCVAPGLPWVENGETRGTVWKTSTAYGWDYRYLDRVRRLQRVEKRGQNDALLPGASVTKFVYDLQGEVAEELHCDAVGALAMCEEGYAVKTSTNSVSDSGDHVATQVFLDTQRKPVCTTNGYAVARWVYDGATPELKEVFFENEQRRPASISRDGVNGVAHVKYMVVQGIGDVRYAVYYGPSGDVAARKKLSGSTSVSYRN